MTGQLGTDSLLLAGFTTEIVVYLSAIPRHLPIRVKGLGGCICIFHQIPEGGPYLAVLPRRFPYLRL